MKKGGRNVLVPIFFFILSASIWTRQHQELDPISPDLDPETSGYGSGFAGSRSGEIRIWIRFCRIQIRQYPDLDPFWPDLDPGSGSKEMVMDPFRL